MNPFKVVLLLIFAPRFRADMPPRGSGRYLASAEKYSHFYCHTPQEREVEGAEAGLCHGSMAGPHVRLGALLKRGRYSMGGQATAEYMNEARGRKNA